MSDDTKLDEAAVGEYIQTMPDEVFDAMVGRIGFSAPWQDNSVIEELGGQTADADGFRDPALFGTPAHIRLLQKQCWQKFHTNPQIRSATLDRMGRITGQDFGVSSDIFDIDEYVRKITTDPRNRLYLYWPKYYGRSDIEGELFLALTLHKKDGFVEVDFRDPATLDSIYFHPDKPQMPLFYKFTRATLNKGIVNEIVPSIFIAYYPELWDLAKEATLFSEGDCKASQGRGHPFNKVGGFKRFIVAFDKTMIGGRNVSHLSTTLQWVTHYENMKKYEIDHKKSSGAYVHTFSFEDKTAFRTWVALSDDERRATGVMQKLRPGSRLFLPPGMVHKINSPSLPKISDSDTDIMHMITAGVNQPEDMLTGQSSGTYSSTKASRGPQADRMSDEACYFENFMRYDFWRPVFFLAALTGVLEETYKVERVVDFSGQKPKKKKVPVEPCELLEFTFPTSAISDPETVARAYLGVKHGSVASTLGIPMSLVAKRMGFGNYKRLRLIHAAEEEHYPELKPEVDQEAAQEKQIGEPQKTGAAPAAKPGTKPAAKQAAKPATGKPVAKASDTDPVPHRRRIPAGLIQTTEEGGDSNGKEG